MSTHLRIRFNVGPLAHCSSVVKTHRGSLMQNVAVVTSDSGGGQTQR